MEYLAPEFIADFSENNKVVATHEMDLFSLGRIIQFCMSGVKEADFFPEFSSASVAARSDQPLFTPEKYKDRGTAEIIKGLLEKNPLRRASLTALKVSLKTKNRII